MGIVVDVVAIVTYFSNAYHTYGIPDIVEFTMTNATILDESTRVKKAMDKKKQDNINREINRKQYALKKAQRELDDAKKRIKDLS